MADEKKLVQSGKFLSATFLFRRHRAEFFLITNMICQRLEFFRFDLHYPKSRPMEMPGWLCFFVSTSFMGKKTLAAKQDTLQRVLPGQSTTTWTQFYPILPNFDSSPPSSGQKLTFYILLSTICYVTNIEFLLTPPALLVHVGIECPFRYKKRR